MLQMTLIMTLGGSALLLFIVFAFEIRAGIERRRYGRQWHRFAFPAAALNISLARPGSDPARDDAPELWPRACFRPHWLTLFAVA